MSINWILTWNVIRTKFLRWKIPVNKDVLIVQQALRRQVEYLRLEVKQQKTINTLLKRRVVKQDELLTNLSKRIEMDGKLIDDFIRGNVTAPIQIPETPTSDPYPDLDFGLGPESEPDSDANLLEQEQEREGVEKTSATLDDSSLTYDYEDDEELEKLIQREKLNVDMETPQKYKRPIPIKRRAT